MKKLLSILILSLTIGYAQFNGSYFDVSQNAMFTKDYVIHNGVTEPIDTVIVNYEKDVTIYTPFHKYTINYWLEATPIWISFTQMMNPYPPYYMYDTVFVSTNKVGLYFE